MTRSRLIDLAERCERAQGPSRELDAEVWACTVDAQTVVGYELAEGWSYRAASHHSASENVAFWAERDNGLIQAIRPAPSYTESVDAALSLCNGHDGSNKAAVLHSAMFQRHMGDIKDDRLALHLCAYILRALASQEPDDDHK